jgi:hypothetical protein
MVQNDSLFTLPITYYLTKSAMTRTLLITLHNALGLLVLLVAVFIVGAYTLFVPTATHAQAKPCGVYSVAYNVPAGYGATFNVDSLTRGLLLQSMCDTAGFSATIGSSATSPTNFAVYKTGYRWDGSKWAAITMAPNGGTASGSYVMGNAKSSATLAYTDENTYWVSFACVLNSGKWKCGCRDVFCQSSFWNLQVAYNSPPPVVPGGDGGGTAGGGADIPFSCEKENYTVSGGKTTTVNSVEGLKSALKSASAGDTIILGSGSYNVDIRSGLQFSGYVAIKGSSGAKVTKMFLKGAKNLQLDGIKFEYGTAEGQSAWKPKVLEIQESENVRVINSDIVGYRKGTLLDRNMPEAGARFVGIKNLTFSSNNIDYVKRGVISQSIDGFLYEFNVFHNVGFDGFMNQLVHNGAFQSNYFPTGLRNGGSTAHPDYFQFDGGKGRHDSHPGKNIVIRGNVMLQGSNENNYPCKSWAPCGDVQGAFVAGVTKSMTHVYENVSITDNVYCGQGLNGIVVGQGGKNITIKNNAHFTCPRSDGKMSSIRGVEGDEQSNVVISNNATGKVSGDAEAIAKAKELPGINNCILKGL